VLLDRWGQRLPRLNPTPALISTYIMCVIRLLVPAVSCLQAFYP
jgi:hypothetical protein